MNRARSFIVHIGFGVPTSKQEINKYAHRCLIRRVPQATYHAASFGARPPGLCGPITAAETHPLNLIRFAPAEGKLLAGRVPRLRARAKALVVKHKREPRTLIDEAIRLAAAGEEELAFEFFRAVPKAVAAMTPAEIEGLLPRLRSWETTDSFGCFVSGVAWRIGVLTDKHILAWTKSDHLWTRRAALVSTVPLNLRARGATAPAGEPARTLAVCAALVDDREDMVVKALSWALRTLATRDARAVRAFLSEHDGRVAPRALRETRNKLTTGKKNPRAKGE